MYGLYQIVYFTIIDILRILKSPFFVLIIIIIYFQYKENIEKPILATISSIFYGMIGGLIATVVLLYLQVYLVPMDFIYIFIVTILLSLIDTRFICFAYGGSTVVLLNLIFGFPDIDRYDLMQLVAVLHMVEALLIVLNGDYQRKVTHFTLGYNSVGGYTFSRIWPLPLVLFIGDTMIKPITIAALLNYGDFTVSNYPKDKTLKSGVALFFYGLILLIVTRLNRNPYLAPLVAITGHEFIIHINKYRERARMPLFIDPAEGVRVLEVKQRSVARKIGISKGDIILRINETPINDEKDLKDIEDLNQNMYKIKYFNIKKGIVVKIYKGKRKTLGIISLPRVP